MIKTEERVINAFTNCVKSGEYTYDKAVVMLNNDMAYGWISQTAKDAFYKAFENPEPVPADGLDPMMGVMDKTNSGLVEE